MAFESLIIRAIVAGVLVGAPRWYKACPKTSQVGMSRAPSRELEVMSESESLSPEYVRLMGLVRDSYYEHGREMQYIENIVHTSKECQVVASFLQLALTNDAFLNVVDRKFEQGKLGLSASEWKHVEKVLKNLWLDRANRRNNDLLKSVHVLLYARVHNKIASEDLVVAGSGNAHIALLSPKRLEENVWPKTSDYVPHEVHRRRNV